MKYSDIKCRQVHHKDRIFPDPVTVSHQWIGSVLEEGMVAVDATAGNGYDTIFLAKKVGVTGKVYSFDIQEVAIKNTKKQLLATGLAERVELFHQGHENLLNFVKTPINAMIFNLGYLPRGNKNIITKKETTLQALKSGMELLLPNGLIVLTIYTGHEGGLEEWIGLRDFIKTMPIENWHIFQLTFPNRHQRSPFNIGIQRISS